MDRINIHIKAAVQLLVNPETFQKEVNLTHRPQDIQLNNNQSLTKSSQV